MEKFIVYLLILLVFIPVLIMIRYTIRKSRKIEFEGTMMTNSNINSSEILGDLDFLIRKECKKFEETALTYRLAKLVTMMEMSNLGSALTVITDEILEEEVTKISEKIIERMSDVYRDNLLLVISEDYIDSYIYEETYSILLETSLRINTGLDK